MIKYVWLLTPAFLAACGGGSDGIAATSAALSNGDPIPSTINMAEPTKNILGFTAEDDGSDDAILYSAVREDTYVRVGASTSAALGPFAGQEYARLGSVVLPAGGTAIFTGDYIGVLQNRDAVTPNYDALNAITGDATLTASFGASTISGDITNRQTYAIANGAGPTADTLTDVNLGTANITNSATFSGATTGGKFTSPALTPLHASGDLVGTFSGLFGGGSGDVVAGRVSIAHDYVSATGIEEGVFIATD